MSFLQRMAGRRCSDIQEGFRAAAPSHRKVRVPSGHVPPGGGLEADPGQLGDDSFSPQKELEEVAEGS